MAWSQGRIDEMQKHLALVVGMSTRAIGSAPATDTTPPVLNAPYKVSPTVGQQVTSAFLGCGNSDDPNDPEDLADWRVFIAENMTWSATDDVTPASSIRYTLTESYGWKDPQSDLLGVRRRRVVSRGSLRWSRTGR